MPRRSRSRASIASDHGAWTRPPNGDQQRQPPVAELVAEPLDDDALVGGQRAGRVALVLQVREQVLGGAVVEVVVVLQPLRGGLPSFGSAVQIALELPDERAERAAELDRATDGIALPERQLARDAGCGCDGDAVVADVQDPPRARPEDDDVAVHPGSELVHHLLVELADATAGGPRLALHEDAEQATIRDGAAARHGHDAGVAAALDGVGHAIPHKARLELGELVGWVGAGEHAEDAIHDVARQGLVGGGFGHRPEQVVAGPCVHHRHRDELLSEHVQWIARDPGLSRSAPSCMRRVTTATSRRSPRYFGKITPLLGAPTW